MHKYVCTLRWPWRYHRNIVLALHIDLTRHFSYQVFVEEGRVTEAKEEDDTTVAYAVLGVGIVIAIVFLVASVIVCRRRGAVLVAPMQGRPGLL